MENKVAIIMPIVVPSIYHMKMTRTAIQNVQRFTPPDLYTLVVVHGVNETYGNDVKSRLRKNDLYLGFKENISQPAALNLGIAKTDTKYVCVFSNDIFVHQGWLEPILELLDSGEADIVGPYWRTATYDEFRSATSNGEKFLGVNNFRALGMNGPVMKREMYEKIGPFDERLTRIFWDMDYGIRINDLNLKIGYSSLSQASAMNEATICSVDNVDPEMSKFWYQAGTDAEAAAFREKWGERTA